MGNTVTDERKLAVLNKLDAAGLEWLKTEPGFKFLDSDGDTCMVIGWGRVTIDRYSIATLVGAYCDKYKEWNLMSIPDMGNLEGCKPIPITECQQPDGCEGNSKLDESEYKHPAECALCDRVLCDTCAASAEWIPRGALKLPLPTSDFSTYAGFLCSEHFNEEWV